MVKPSRSGIYLDKDVKKILDLLKVVWKKKTLDEVIDELINRAGIEIPDI